jgi:3-phosphoshikimate 1-carboxyvinyltransferase
MVAVNAISYKLPFNGAGVDAECTLGTGCPPVRVQAKGLQGGSISISGAVSSQYLTALLMAAPLAQDEEVCC